MRVGMKEPVHQDHLAEDVDQDPRDVPRIDSESTKRRDVRHAHPGVYSSTSTRRVLTSRTTAGTITSDRARS